MPRPFYLAATPVEFPATADGPPVCRLLVDVDHLEAVARLKKGAFTFWLQVNSTALKLMFFGSGEPFSCLLRWHRVHAMARLCTEE